MNLDNSSRITHITLLTLANRLAMHDRQTFLMAQILLLHLRICVTYWNQLSSSVTPLVNGDSFIKETYSVFSPTFNITYRHLSLTRAIIWMYSSTSKQLLIHLETVAYEDNNCCHKYYKYHYKHLTQIFLVFLELLCKPVFSTFYSYIIFTWSYSWKKVSLNVNKIRSLIGKLHIWFWYRLKQDSTKHSIIFRSQESRAK
jgi:hypothetical protein